eukprot:CAMPEP_0198283152 /NCGR_PEP_ID=MMETSP1449-20131203/2824_1 /TAXON_ID=420275 /ORGANISM="Attheya septentrionalis, Strain CCMP2084" /LENGTH=293 /DNA_ID=CAMNT_0043979677 /DNA_START=100 /DNA_END=981 /DNA_ORIENTATION=+
MTLTSASLIAVAAALLLTNPTDGFGMSSSAVRRVEVSSQSCGMVMCPSPRSSRMTFLRAEEETEAESGDAEEVVAEVVAEEEAEEEEPKEDVEIAALNEEIAKVETKIKTTRKDLNSAKNSVDEYSQAGYARKVAQMENMRKIRGATFTNNKFSAKANVVKSFLPVKEAVEAVATEYGEDEFGKKYNAIKGAFNSALKQLDVVEFEAEVGQPMDISRAVSVEEEYSDEFARGTVLRPVKMGLELQGNVMQMAEIVASLGSEADAKAEEEAAAAAAAAKEEEATPEEEEEEASE